MSMVRVGQSLVEEQADALAGALKAAGDPAPEFSAEMAAGAIRQSARRVYLAIKRLIAQGRAEVSCPGAGPRPTLWRLTEAPVAVPAVPAAPVKDAVDHMWTVIRKLDRVTMPAVLEHVRVGDPRVSERAVRDYIRALLAADYLTVLLKARRGREAVYRLKPGHGVGAPRVRRVLAVVDPNKGSTILLSRGAP